MEAAHLWKSPIIENRPLVKTAHLLRVSNFYYRLFLFIFSSNAFYPLGSLRVNWVSDKIYWTNTTTTSIWVSNMDGSSRAMLLKLEHRPHHLRVDTVSGQLYYIAREDGLRKSVVYR